MTTLRMPLSVHLELVEDRLDDLELVPWVTEAVDTAVGRAVDRALAVRLVSHGTVGPEPPRLSVRFTGDALPQRVAATLEASLRTSLSLAAARLGAGPDTDAATDAGAGDAPGHVVVPSEQAEELDSDRMVVDEGGEDGYQVPYYGRGGDPLTLPLHGRARPGARAREVPERFALRLRQFATADELWAAVLERTSGHPPARLVAVFESAADHAVHAQFIDRGGPGAPPAVVDTQISVWSYPTGVGRAILVRPNFAKADTWSRVGRAEGAAEQHELRKRMQLMVLRAAGVTGRDEVLSEQADELLKDLPPFVGAVMYADQLTLHGRVVWIGESDVDLSSSPRAAYVLTETVPLEPDEDTYGNCPPLEADSAASWLTSIGLLHPDPVASEDAFLSELAIELWPAEIYDGLRTRMRHVASLLHVSPTRFVGSFLISAMAQIDKRCRRLANSGAPMGYQLSEMASAFGPMRDLAQYYGEAMTSLDRDHKLPCPLAGQTATWRLRFVEVLSSARDDAVASMFVSTCQDVLLQVLFATKAELHKRAVNFSTYMPLTRLLMMVMLSDTVDLMELRDSLIEREQRDQAMALAAGGVLGGPTASAAWLRLTGSLVDQLADEPASRELVRGTVRQQRDGYRVYDGAGRWWSRAELDAVIGSQRQQVVGIDPLLDKVSGIDELVRRLRAAQRIDAVASTTMGAAITSSVDDIFRDLIGDLIDENARRLKQAAADRTLAFGLATFSRDDDVTSASEVGARLSGIHKLADERLRPAFTDQDAYVAGVARLAAEEIGKSEIIEFLTFVGLAALSVLCPPLAFAVGAVQAIEGLETAFEHRDLQRAMLGGDEILSKAQVEAELWGAAIGAALSFLPELPALARGAGSATRALAKGEALELAGAATRQAMRRISARLAEMSVEHFTKAFAKELVTGYLINLALSKAMSRIADAVARQVTVTGGASATDLADVLGQALAGPPTSGGVR